jgi:hypothetical protein
MPRQAHDVGGGQPGGRTAAGAAQASLKLSTADSRRRFDQNSVAGGLEDDLRIRVQAKLFAQRLRYGHLAFTGQFHGKNFIKTFLPVKISFEETTMTWNG